MDFFKIKERLRGQNAQILVFDREGSYIDSCNTIISVPKNVTTIADLSPFFESIKLSAENLEEGEELKLPAMDIPILCKRGIYDITIRIDKIEKYFLVLIEEKTKFYQNVRLIQQERNQYSVDNEVLNQQLNALKLEREILQNKVKELKNRAEARNDFFSKVSHELRTPINSIVGLTELLSDFEFETEATKYLKVLRTSSEHLANILNDVLDLSKLEAQKFVLHNGPVDLRSLIEEVVLSFQYHATTKNLGLKYNIDPKLPKWVKADPVRIKQILYNLLSNAFKYTEEGYVEVTVSDVVITGQFVDFSLLIRDTGIGISSNKLETVFEEYEQDGKQEFFAYKGTGLGLSVVRNLVELYGGKVVARSGNEPGTVFKINLKMELCPEPDKMEEFIVQLPKKKLEILVAEDDMINRMVIERYLSGNEYQVKLASNGREALSMLMQQRFDLLLTDNFMPEMSGLELVSHLYEYHPEMAANMHFVLLTGDVVTNKPKFSQKYGLSAVLNKPVQRHEILAVISKL